MRTTCSLPRVMTCRGPRPDGSAGPESLARARIFPLLLLCPAAAVESRSEVPLAGLLAWEVPAPGPAAVPLFSRCSRCSSAICCHHWRVRSSSCSR